MTWDLLDLPDQTGRRTLVTGCTVGGLGHHVALELARRGGSVVLAGRTRDRLDEAVVAIRREVPDADTATLVVDLADLESVRRAAGEAAAFGPVDCLVNNAGVMATPQRRTADGFDLQLATNHLGPFLLTGLLLPQLVESGAGRVVAVASQMHRAARAAPVGEPRVPQAGRYQRWQTYAQTKLANLLFTFEADRRLRRAGLPVIATASHPGYAGTHLVVNGQTGGLRSGFSAILHGANRAVSQSAADGALPLLMAATADIPGSSYCGPSGLYEMRGEPRLVSCTRRAQDLDLQRALWEVSERATGLAWP